MTEPVPDPATARPVAPELPPPLAEGRWLYRRLYVFATSAAAWVLLDRLAAAVPAEAAPRLAHALMGLLALVLVLYLVAPTAQQLITALAALKAQGAPR